jgi:inosose dehydratase
MPDDHLQRRQFISSLGTAAAAPALGRASPSWSAENESPKNDYGGFPVGIQTYSLRHFDTYTAIRHMHALDVRYAEFTQKHLEPTAPLELIDKVRHELSKVNIKATAHGVNRFSADHAENRKLFQFSKRAGYRNLTASPSPVSFDSLGKLVDEFDIRIAIHNHGPGSEYDKLEDVTKPLQGKHRLIGACIDTGHFLRSRVDPIRVVYELGSRCFAMHIKDVAGDEPEAPDVILGTGRLDLTSLFRALRDVQFPDDGTLSVEYESNPQDPMEDIKQSLANSKAAIAKI